MEVEKSWKRFFLNGGYLYRVTKLETESLYDGQFYDITNELMDLVNVDEWEYICHIKKDIREWLEASLPFIDWKAERPRYMGDKNLGILFRRRKHVMLFKIVWG